MTFNTVVSRLSWLLFSVRINSIEKDGDINVCLIQKQYCSRAW